MSAETSRATVGPAWAANTGLAAPDVDLQQTFRERARPILERHRAQTAEQVAALKRRYARPVFGRVRVWDLVEKLGSCVDPTDERLFGASQQMHVLQMLAAMEADGVATPQLVLVALIHDLGKVLLLTGADPAEVVCLNGPVGEPVAGAGLDNTLIQWNHDELAYDRLKDHIPEDLAWLIRYHSIEAGTLAPAMDARDLERTERLLLPFARYDHAFKSPFNVPPVAITRYRDVIEDAFPHRIRF